MAGFCQPLQHERPPLGVAHILAQRQRDMPHVARTYPHRRIALSDGFACPETAGRFGHRVRWRATPVSGHLFHAFAWFSTVRLSGSSRRLTRPKPLSRTPPKPAAASIMLVPFTLYDAREQLGPYPAPDLISRTRPSRPELVAGVNWPVRRSAGVRNVVDTSTGQRFVLHQGIAGSCLMYHVGG